MKPSCIKNSRRKSLGLFQ